MFSVFLFDRGSNGSSYSSASEILHYFKSVAQDYGLMKYMQLNCKVIDARWDDDEQQWHLKLQNTISNEVFKDTAHVLVNASGVLK